MVSEGEIAFASDMIHDMTSRYELPIPPFCDEQLKAGVQLQCRTSAKARYRRKAVSSSRSDLTADHAW